MAFAVLTDLSYSRIIPLATGLDPSWANAITRAAQLHLVFGRSIVFTYGPLGYLIVGTDLPGMFSQIFLARVCLALTFSAFVLYYCAKLEYKFFLITIATIVIATFIIRGYLAAAPITATVAISVLLLDRRSKHQSYEALAIGVFTGLATLAKFTLGVQFAGAVGAVLLFQAIGAKHTRLRTNPPWYSLGVFLVGAIATMSATLDGSIAPPAICWPVWSLCILGAIFAISNRVERSKTVVLAWALSVLTLLILILIGDTKDFITNSLQISFGYSSAMNIAPASHSSAELSMGVLLLLLLFLVAMSQHSVLSPGAISGLLILGWLNFKEGYVREGPGHVIEYLTPMVLIFAVMTMSSPSRRALTLSILAFSVAMYCFAAKTFEANPLSNVYTLSRLLAPGHDVREAFGMTNADDNAFGGFRPDVFDDDSASRLRSQPVDIQPSETTVAFANDLTWSPEPVFQSVSAYTPDLDLINSESLALGGRRVLVDFTAIDNRNFMAESPLARRALLCNYELDPQFGKQLARIKSGEQFAVLSVAPVNRCHRSGNKTSKAITWDRAYPLPTTSSGTLTFLALDMPFSLRGAITKTLFRGPEVTIDIRDRSGALISSRILPENAVNGFLVNPNPTNLNDFVRIFSDELGTSSTTFTLHTNQPEMFSPHILATIETDSYIRN